jgi:transcriptional regulator with XRE-family HTH domain
VVLPLHLALRERRLALKLSSTEAGRECGVAQPVYSRWETNKQPPGKESLEAIARFLDLPLPDVVVMWLGGEEKPDPQEITELRGEVAELRQTVEELLRRIPPTQGR